MILIFLGGTYREVAVIGVPRREMCGPHDGFSVYHPEWSHIWTSVADVPLYECRRGSSNQFLPDSAGLRPSHPQVLPAANLDQATRSSLSEGPGSEAVDRHTV